MSLLKQQLLKHFQSLHFSTVSDFSLKCKYYLSTGAF